MIRQCRTLLVASVLLWSAVPALAIDPFFPTFGNNGIDAVQYDINLDVNPVSGAVRGKTSILILAQRDLPNFKLDLHGLTVTRVIADGSAALFSQFDDKLTIWPSRTIAEGRKFAVSVEYGGVPQALPDPTAPGSDLLLGWFKYNNSTYVVSEPVGASTFFPANDEPTDKARYTFAITVPEGYTAVANGSFEGSAPLGTKRRFDWTMQQPMTSWLATIHVNKLNLAESTAPDGTPIRIYTPAGVPKSHIKAYALAGDMLAYFETKIGRYPFESYGSVVVKDPILYYGLETQAMTTFPDQTGVPDEAFIAHELAHQWFGDSVSVAHWEDLWIAEGTATYFEVLWSNRGSPAAFDAAMLDIYNYVADQQLGPAVVSAPEDLFSDRTYYRGAAALYALRLRVGDSSFFNILRHFAQENRGGNVTSADFINTATQWSGDGGVRPLLKAWLYDQAVPALPGATARTSAKGPAPRPNIVGGRCGRGSHRGAKASCD